MTTTLSRNSTESRQASVRAFLPAVASYDLIAPTSANFGLPKYPLRRIEVTSGLIDADATAAIIAASGWLAAAVHARLIENTDLSRRVFVGLRNAAVRGGTKTKEQQIGIREPQKEVRRLRDEIQAKGALSQQQIAQLVGVDRRSLSGWVSGDYVPSKVNIERLRTLRVATNRLSHLGAPELAVSLRDAPTAGEVAVAIKTSNVDRAVDAVLGSRQQRANTPRAPSLSPGQRAALVQLAAGVDTVEEITAESVDRSEGTTAHSRSRVRMDAASYATPLRPRRR